MFLFSLSFFVFSFFLLQLTLFGKPKGQKSFVIEKLWNHFWNKKIWFFFFFEKQNLHLKMTYKISRCPISYTLELDSRNFVRNFLKRFRFFNFCWKVVSTFYNWFNQRSISSYLNRIINAPFWHFKCLFLAFFFTKDIHTGPWGLVWKPRPICGGKMMSKKKHTGHEKG